MINYKLFLDPYEVEYPSLVRDILADAHRKTNLSAIVTPLGKCILICGNSVFVWSCTSREMGIPHATRMNLPASGLKYNINLLCLFSKGHQHNHSICLLAVSPEGNVRYWPELGKPHRDESCLLNNEVAHSVQLVDSQEQIHRFLVSTTTGSFHMIDIFHGSAGQPEKMATRPLDVGGPGGGIGRRMSLLLFGSSAAEKEKIIKTIFVRGKIGSADLINVLPRYLRFYTIFERKALLHEIDISDMALNKYNQGRERTERRHFLIVDAALYRTGILLFLVGMLPYHEHKNSDKQLFIGYYEEGMREDEAAQNLKTLAPIVLPESLSATGMEKRLSNSHLFVPSADECAIAFFDAFLLIRHPTNTKNLTTLCMENFGEISEQLLGVAAVYGFSHLLLKEKGVCTVRRLPEHYDLNFWKKFRSVLHQMEEPNVFPGTEQRLKDAFIEFCAKNIKNAKSILRDLFNSLKHPLSGNEFPQNMESQLASTALQKAENNIAEMSVDLLLYLLDRQPSVHEDPRWAYMSNSSLSTEQKGQLHELASKKKFALILRQLGNKHAHYKMVLLFMRTFSLLEWIDHPLQAFQNHSGKAVIAELGEKLAAMIVCFQWLAENGQSLPVVNAAITDLAKQYITRFGLPKGNPYLSAVDLIFNRVSSFHELVLAVVQASEQTMEKHSDKSKVLSEVGSFLVILTEGINDIQRDEWALRVEDGHSTWLNQPDFLTHFTTHLNTALDFLHSNSKLSTNEQHPHPQQTTLIFEQCVQLADFVLSQQSPAQRNDSKIIARFVSLGRSDVALRLAEKYKDFTMLIVYCHKQLNKQDRVKAIESYKEKFEKDGFHDFLYTWYQQNGMYNHLLAEPGKRVSDFLAQHQNINWIRQIDQGDFEDARRTLRKMGDDENNERKKLIVFSLAKMAALCENEENVVEIAELSEKIRTLHERCNVPSEEAE